MVDTCRRPKMDVALMAGTVCRWDEWDDGKPPKWMVKIMENPIKMDDLGVPLFLETPIYILYLC